MNNLDKLSNDELKEIVDILYESSKRELEETNNLLEIIKDSRTDMEKDRCTRLTLFSAALTIMLSIMVIGAFKVGGTMAIIIASLCLALEVLLLITNVLEWRGIKNDK